MRNIIRIGAGTDGRNRFVAIALGIALAAGPDAAAASTTAGTTMPSSRSSATASG